MTILLMTPSQGKKPNHPQLTIRLNLVFVDSLLLVYCVTNCTYKLLCLGTPLLDSFLLLYNLCFNSKKIQAFSLAEQVLFIDAPFHILSHQLTRNQQNEERRNNFIF